MCGSSEEDARSGPLEGIGIGVNGGWPCAAGVTVSISPTVTRALIRRCLRSVMAIVMLISLAVSPSVGAPARVCAVAVDIRAGVGMSGRGPPRPAQAERAPAG
ncbi:hypothetical protein HNR23_001969 [Nocardiopsis mwathae]|uniref:Uncharacterized protein n=1 Tax=Nocardiopsis mwathae TaxID=1472723 RepID=A0A7W9YGU8_9ACTN|nr:hypothetical protein [Nocardiopsis mwathae]